MVSGSGMSVENNVALIPIPSRSANALNLRTLLEDEDAIGTRSRTSCTTFTGATHHNHIKRMPLVILSGKSSKGREIRGHSTCATHVDTPKCPAEEEVAGGSHSPGRRFLSCIQATQDKMTFVFSPMYSCPHRTLRTAAHTRTTHAAFIKRVFIFCPPPPTRRRRRQFRQTHYNTQGVASKPQCRSFPGCKSVRGISISPSPLERSRKLPAPEGVAAGHKCLACCSPVRNTEQ